MSKGLEALEELLYYANLNFKRENERKTEFTNKIEQMGIDDNEENFKIIEKDLEILEIIKKWSFIQENYKDGYGPFTQFLCNIHTIGMEEDFKKIKEWLENEKQD